MRAPGFSYSGGGVRVFSFAGALAISCDAARAHGITFLSRADVSLGRVVPERLIASEGTIALRKKLGLPTAEALTPRFGRPFSIGRARLELIPAGVLPGSAQLLVELGAWRGLYAGLVSPRAADGTEPLQARGCEEIVVDAPEEEGVVDRLEGDEVLAPADLRAAYALRDRPELALTMPLARALGKKRAKVPAARRVVSGTRMVTDESVRALGLGPTVEEIIRFVVDCGAKRVHVRVPAESPRRIIPARALVAALRKRKIAADLMAPPAQLSLFAP